MIHLSDLPSLRSLKVLMHSGLTETLVLVSVSFVCLRRDVALVRGLVDDGGGHTRIEPVRREWSQRMLFKIAQQ